MALFILALISMLFWVFIWTFHGWQDALTLSLAILFGVLGLFSSAPQIEEFDDDFE